MKFIVIYLGLLFSLFVNAEDNFSNFLSKISHGRFIKSCYRWVNAYEYKKWVKTGRPVFTDIFEGKNKHLARGGKSKKGIYCWHHPAGARRGGSLEVYGDYLMRIDFVDEVVIYDRNLDMYYAKDEAIIDEKKLGIDSQVFYANYLYNNLAWFQEYIIRDPRAIKGFTFNDSDLRDSFENGVEEIMRGSLPRSEAHFYLSSYCPFITSSLDLKRKVFLTNENRYYCEETRQLLRKSLEFLRIFWENEITEKWFLFNQE